MAEKAIFKKIAQVAVVVKDLDASVKKYWDGYGIGPWGIWTFDPSTVKDMSIRGQRVDYAMRVAIATIGDVMWELIQPLDDRSIYAEFLKKHGEGLHHILFEVDNFEDTVTLFRDKSIGVLQDGTWKGNIKYAYFDTEADLSTIAEIYTPPAEGEEFPPPEATYP